MTRIHTNRTFRVRCGYNNGMSRMGVRVTAWTGSNVKITEAYGRLATGWQMPKKPWGTSPRSCKVAPFEIVHKYADLMSLEELVNQL